MNQTMGSVVAAFFVALAACSGSDSLLPPATNGPLSVDESSHIVVLQYEAWFGPHAVTFQQAEAMPILQSKDMQTLGGGYDSADPRVIEQHIKWMQYMGVDAASIDLTNNVGCIFSTGPVSRNLCNPATKAFRDNNRAIRDNVGNLYPAWSKLGAPVKLIPLLGCQTKLDVRKESDGESGFQKETEYFGSLMTQYPQLNVLYLGHPLMLVYVGTPVDVTLLMRCKAVLHESGLDTLYTFRIDAGYLDSQPAFWADPGRRPDGPIKLSRSYRFWSVVDRLKPKYELYPTYNAIPGGSTENLTVSIATPGQQGWGCPRPRLCPEAATRYGPTGHSYVTLGHFMALAKKLRPTFLIVNQFNEFVRPDQGWDAQTSDDTEPTRLPRGWGDSGIKAVRSAISKYKSASLRRTSQ